VKRRRLQQGGSLLILMCVLLIAGAGVMLYPLASPQAHQRAEDAATDAALADAKAALLGYAATTPMENRSTGNLLCPDITGNGIAWNTGNGCAGAANQGLRLGRVPWRTLGVPEARDASGERLWYAVSDNFRSFQPATSHSETSGTITVRDANGQLLYDASIGQGVAAVIIAPGPPLASPRLQKRPSNTAADYLDIARGEDNASFQDGSTNGFIHGPVRASDGNLIMNDRMVVITRDELLAVIEKRFAAEVRNCLVAWAEINHDQFPAPVPIESTDAIGIDGALFGKVPVKISRNYAQLTALSINRLQSARSQFANATPQNVRAATLAISRANKSLIQTTSAVATNALLLKSLTGAALQDKIIATGVDAMITTPQGSVSASSLALNSAWQSAIASGYDNLATLASQAVSYATTASKAADALLQKSTASGINSVNTNTDAALSLAAGLMLFDRTAQVAIQWPTTPNCSWLDPTQNSAWAMNQWQRHLYYQIDQPQLIRDSNGNAAAGALSINGRAGWQLVVIAAGRALAHQNRSTLTPAQLFEGDNAHASRAGGGLFSVKNFAQKPMGDNFNDQLAY
jgi:hypothetical protein